MSDWSSEVNRRDSDHLIRIEDLSRSALLALLKSLETIPHQPSQSDIFWAERQDACRGRIAAVLFGQHSVRTRTSTMSGFMRMAGNCIGFRSLEEMIGSTDERESIADAASFLSQHVDLIVVRSSNSTIVDGLCLGATVPVISAGHGTDEHPTTGLSHLLSIQRRFGSLSGLRVLAIARFPKRCMHSVIAGLLKCGDCSLDIVSPDSPPRLAQWKHMCRTHGGTVVHYGTLSEATKRTPVDTLDVVLCDEGGSDYQEAATAPVAIVDMAFLNSLRAGAHVTHLKPCLRIFTKDVVTMLSPQLLHESWQAGLVRAELMRFLCRRRLDHIQ